MASLQFPLSDQDKYQGRIKFDVIQTIPPTISQRAKRKAQEAIFNSDTLLTGGPEEPVNDVVFDPRGPGQRGENSSYVNKSRDVPTGNRCSIYLPQSIQIQDGVAIENVDLGVFGANIAAGIMSGTSIIEAAVDAGAEVFSSISDFFRGNLSQDAARAAASRLSGVAGDTRAAAVRSALQTTPAPNTRAIFKSVNIREFSFTFNMLPKTKREAIEVGNIIKFFRQELYPETIDIGSIPVAYKFPNKFAISIQYNGKEVATKILNSYLRNFQTNYNPNAMSFYSGGYFQETQITMSFVEARTLDKKDIEKGF